MHHRYRGIPPEQLDLAVIEYACREETRRFRRDEESDPRYCLEIFHRALRLSNPLDEEARTLLVTMYTDVIRAYINRKAFTGKSLEDLIQEIWMRFWQAAGNGLLFSSLSAALNYIHQTTLSAVFEEKRKQLRKWNELPIADLGFDKAHEVAGSDHVGLAGHTDELFDSVLRAHFRERCREVLNDPLVYRIFWLREGMGIPARQIAQKLASEGRLLKGKPPTARAVSDVLERAFRRLAADDEIRDLLRGD